MGLFFGRKSNANSSPLAEKARAEKAAAAKKAHIEHERIEREAQEKIERGKEREELKEQLGDQLRQIKEHVASGKHVWSGTEEQIRSITEQLQDLGFTDEDFAEILDEFEPDTQAIEPEAVPIHPRRQMVVKSRLVGMTPQGLLGELIDWQNMEHLEKEWLAKGWALLKLEQQTILVQMQVERRKGTPTSPTLNYPPHDFRRVLSSIMLRIIQRAQDQEANRIYQLPESEYHDALIRP
jgi:hypothetical protein